MQPQDIYQRYLKDEFERRKSRNASYSLRAFARDLGVPSSKLSQYLSGDCGISSKKAAALASALRLSPVETELFVFAAEAAHARDPFTRERAQEQLDFLLKSTFSEINMEKFQLIADWHHFAILELTELESFESSVSWVAQALQISEQQVTEAVKRLEHVELLNCRVKKWTQEARDLETPADFSSRAIREYHHQMLQLVDSRFESIPVERREMGSVLLGLDPELLPELKRLIRGFQKDVAVLAERSRKKTSLYTLNLQLMPLFEGETLPCENS